MGGGRTARVGLPFTDEAPTVDTFGLQLGSEEIDIPAGATDFRIHDSFTLPVAVDAIGIDPHAHYPGKRMEVWATLPDGSRRWLLLIEDWDFAWQDDYRDREPVPLPAGTVLEMVYTYDNSSGNPHDP